MAEEQDRSQKTEEPTQRRLDEARRKGQVASSREVNHAFMLAVAALAVAAIGPGAASGVGEALLPFIAAPHAIPAGAGELAPLLAALLGDLGIALLALALAFVGAALAGGLIQNGPVLSATPLAPKLERISPVAGAKRLFSARSLLEFAKGLVKICLVSVAAILLILPSAPAVLESAQLEAGPLLGMLGDLSFRLLLGVAALTAVIGVIDVGYQRYEHRRQLRMSRRELQEEFRHTEGDPLIKARLKGLRAERARRRMMAEVPKATVVITNPTHVAVALRYESATMAAPQLVAKGSGPVAERIREVARTHGVPLLENPPLARALHASVELGAEIPPEHYRAVAEVIGYVMRIGGRR
jgi:flagellar biosynthetic protein FlhB